MGWRGGCLDGGCLRGLVTLTPILFFILSPFEIRVPGLLLLYRVLRCLNVPRGRGSVLTRNRARLESGGGCSASFRFPSWHRGRRNDPTLGLIALSQWQMLYRQLPYFLILCKLPPTGKLVTIFEFVFEKTSRLVGRDMPSRKNGDEDEDMEKHVGENISLVFWPNQSSGKVPSWQSFPSCAPGQSSSH